ncbi:winged helix-turn-helix domain-containing protein [Occallatibacter riparius]|uniref:Winged helix-turn-helix domain-containing protein n=1 Tax=Occallatibacter riparius TaxID=1002689 RepID=A0A9J7BY51_9BACT|nr:winged helix-turn-helix domain-containing protein [Occallatibacter riparius]UWZ87010.1 winged helix-turn-helix domain-containing protein [Occallatibacter riparius]
MTTLAHTTQTWRFGVFEVDAHAGELRRAGVHLKLREQSFKVLVLLLERAGDLVTREELRNALWPADTFVDFDHSLNAAVMHLREALGDTADKPLYIETIPKHGYRFIAPLAPSPGIDKGTAAAKPSRVRGKPRPWLAVSVGAGTLALVAALWLWFWPRHMMRVTEYVQLTHDGWFKEVAAADGSRVYVNLFFPVDSVVQVPLTGGELTGIPIRLPGEDRPIPGLEPGDHPLIYDLSRDGLTFLCAGPSYSLWSVAITGNPLRQLGQAVGAAWSPDGKRLVYTWRGEIFVVRSDGTEVHQIAATKSFKDAASDSDMNWVVEGSMSWSPDGTRIRFTRLHELWEVSPDGTGLHAVLPGWKPSSWKSSGRWTPDGEYYIFLSGEPNMTPFMAGNQLWALDERHSWRGQRHREPIQLTFGPTRWGHPIPSRDGNSVFARGIVLNGELLRFDEQTQRWSPFLGGRSAQFVSYSPDRRFVAYVSFPEEVLYRANVDGSGAIQMTDSTLAVKCAEWSPDGSQILICAQKGTGAIQMYLVPALGGPPKRLMPDGKEPEVDPHWSPDGKKVVYSNLGNVWNTLHPVEIRIYDLSTHAVTALPGSGEDFSPRWSPDARYIAALTVSEHKLKVFDLTSNRWRTIYEGFANFPVWSRDSKYVYIPLWSQGIVRTPIAGGRPQLIAPLKETAPTGSLGGWFGVDPQGAPLVLLDKGSNEVYALQLSKK